MSFLLCPWYGMLSRQWFGLERTTNFSLAILLVATHSCVNWTLPYISRTFPFLWSSRLKQQLHVVQNSMKIMQSLFQLCYCTKKINLNFGLFECTVQKSCNIYPEIELVAMMRVNNKCANLEQEIPFYRFFLTLCQNSLWYGRWNFQPIRIYA